MQRKSIIALALALGLGLCSASHIASADTKVGDTKDACDQHDAVSVTAKSGKVTVKAGTSAQFWRQRSSWIFTLS